MFLTSCRYVLNDPVNVIDPLGLYADMGDAADADDSDQAGGDYGSPDDGLGDDDGGLLDTVIDFLMDPMGNHQENIQRTKDYAEEGAQQMGGVINMYRDFPVPTSLGDLIRNDYEQSFQERKEEEDGVTGESEGWEGNICP